MGYKSRVAIVLKKEVNAQLKADIVMCVNGHQQKIMNFLKSAEIHTKENGDVLYSWDWMKWYDDYPVISFIKKFLERADDSTYHYIRLGEENDDMEERGHYWDDPFDLRIIRDIKYDV